VYRHKHLRRPNKNDVGIVVGENESFESAVSRFIRAVKKSKKLTEVKKHEVYIKPSDLKKKKERERQVKEKWKHIYAELKKKEQEKRRRKKERKSVKKLQVTDVTHKDN